MVDNVIGSGLVDGRFFHVCADNVAPVSALTNDAVFDVAFAFVIVKSGREDNPGSLKIFN